MGLTKYCNPEERQLVELAIGRILRLGSRPLQDGDIADYERCRAIIMDHASYEGNDYQVNYTRDYNKGAQGD